MDKRRIQKIKGGSYIITLPPDWVRRNGLDAKSEVFVIEKDGELLIKPQRAYDDKKRIDLKEVDIDTAKYLISVYYMQGASEIEVVSDSVIPAEVKNELKGLQLILPDLQVEDESFNYIKFSVNDDLSTNIVEEMKSFSQKLLVLLEDLGKVISNPNRDMAIDIKSRAEDLNRIYNSLIRKIALLSQKEEQFNFRIESVRDLILYAIAMRDMGRMISHIRTASTMLSSYSLEVPEVLKSISSELVTMFKEALEVFFYHRLEYIKDIRKRMKDINRVVDSLDKDHMELGKELARIGSYCIALMDDGVHMSVRL